MGVVTALANDPKELFDRLMSGESSVSNITRFSTDRCPVKTAAEIQDFHGRTYGIGQRDLRILDRYQQYALAAAEMAIIDSRLDLPRYDILSTKDRRPQITEYGAAVGVSCSSTEVLAQQFRNLNERGARGVSPYLFNNSMPNSATSAISVRFGLGGPLVTVSGASAAGAESLIAAYEKVKFGRADVMLAGGAESPITELIVSGFAQNRTGSKSGVCRPFDKRRDGTILGEGAGILVLEEIEHARDRGAFIYGRILGYGLRSDAFSLSDISTTVSRGLVAALREALDDASIEPTELDYVNAHATATEKNDLVETMALKQVFGKYAYQLKVSGIKGSVGHMLGAAGAVELIVSLLACCRNEVPPTFGLEVADPRCDLQYVPGIGKKSNVRYSASISVAMGGANSVIILEGNKLHPDPSRNN
jgi:3-oxoacyl-[acyl-carrier-protein] synthase II